MTLEPNLVHKTRTSLTFQWRVDEGAEGYQIFRTKQGWGEEEVLLAYIHPNQPMFADPGLAPGTIYRYRIVESLADDEVREAQEWRGGARTDPATEFQSPEEFFTEFLSPVFARSLTQSGHAKWCFEWWRHPEAMRVVEALWWAYEDLRPTTPPELPTRSRADFLVYHCYPLMDRLFAEWATFRTCETKHAASAHLPQPPLPQVVNPAP